MEFGAVNNFHVIVKQINNFDGRETDEFLEWHSKLCASALACTTRHLTTSYKGRSGRQN